MVAAKPQITAAQLRMARALLKISGHTLAGVAGLDANTIWNFESGKGVYPGTIAKLTEALQARGVVFIDENPPHHGPGVAMRHGLEPLDGNADESSDRPEVEVNGTHAAAWDEAYQTTNP